MKIAWMIVVGLVTGGLLGCSSRPYTEESVIKAQADYNATHVSTAPASTPSTGAAPAPAANQPASQNFRGMNALHWISLVLDQGKRIKLEDGSIWTVSETDSLKTKFWSVANTINVVNGVNSDYPYRMTNADKSEYVDARLISQK